MYKVKCESCGATALVKGSFDPETNTTEIGEPQEWEDGNEDCQHIEYTIVSEIDEDVDWETESL